jgi:hypothetical protein
MPMQGDVRRRGHSVLHRDEVDCRATDGLSFQLFFFFFFKEAKCGGDGGAV